MGKGGKGGRGRGGAKAKAKAQPAVAAGAADAEAAVVAAEADAPVSLVNAKLIVEMQETLRTIMDNPAFDGVQEQAPSQLGVGFSSQDRRARLKQAH